MSKEKSPIREKIEKIMSQPIGSVFIDTCNKGKTKYRMKLCCNHKLTVHQVAAIKNLSSHVIEVGTWSGPYSGIVVYFDCKPSTIEIVKVSLSKLERPPLGLKPRWLHEEHRIQEIEAAMVRYSTEEKEIPKEWKEELLQLRNSKYIR